jgi:phage major head subunit gpT-like protein
MGTLDRIDIFTQALNTAFVNGYDAVIDPPPIDKCITEVPSKGRVENYPWLFPPPLMHQWKGYRQYAKLGETNYRVPNVTYTAEFEIMKEDLDDDQIGGWKKQAAQLGQGAKIWRSIQTQITLANGQTTGCFDGTNFFAGSHTIGTGNNIFTATTASADGLTHAMVGLIIANNMVKPLLWQNRDGPNFMSDAGSEASQKSRMVKNWSDLRGAAAFGFWWDAILCKFANTPTVAEIQTALGTMNARFRQFTYPKNLASDPNQYVHGQISFTASTLVIVFSSLIEHVVRQALTLSLIANTENYFKGFADLVCSGYLDAVV